MHLPRMSTRRLQRRKSKLGKVPIAPLICHQGTKARSFTKKSLCTFEPSCLCGRKYSLGDSLFSLNWGQRAADIGEIAFDNIVLKGIDSAASGDGNANVIIGDGCACQARGSRAAVCAARR